MDFIHIAMQTTLRSYGFCDPSDVDALQQRLSVCIDEVFSWMMSNRLQLNTCGDKSGLLQRSSLGRGYFRTTVTTFAVCLQRRRLSCVLGKEVGAHNFTSP